jgi:hypothetical protein
MQELSDIIEQEMFEPTSSRNETLWLETNFEGPHEEDFQVRIGIVENKCSFIYKTSEKITPTRTSTRNWIPGKFIKMQRPPPACVVDLKD